MISFFCIRLWLPLLFLISNLSVFKAEETFVRTVSGKEIPISSIRRFSSFLHLKDLPQRLFEFNGLSLRGILENFELSNLTGNPVRLSSSHTVITSNEKHIPYSPEFDVYLRRGPHYTVALSHSGAPLAVWGPRLILCPVHVVKHPGLFFNIYRSQLEHTRSHVGADTNHNEMHLPSFQSKRSSLFSTRTSVHTSEKQSSCAQCRTVRLAVASDAAFCESMGGRNLAVAKIQAVIALASEPYERQMCIKLSMTHFEMACPGEEDPYFRFGDDPYTILENFQTFWNENRNSIVRDVAHFLPGKYILDGMAGYAHIGGACSISKGYGWSESANPSFIAHELGHNFGCFHTNEGIMTQVWDPKIPPPTDFSAASVSTITNFFNSKSESNCFPACGTSFPPQPSFSSQPRFSPQPSLPSRPSISPRPSISSQPSFSPLPSSPLTPPEKSTCTDSFSSENAFACSSYQVGTIVPSGRNDAFVSINVTQVRNGYILSWKTDSRRTKIYALSFTITMTTDIPIDKISNRVTYERGQRRVSESFSNNDINLPFGMASCCRNYFYIHMNIRFCNKDVLGQQMCTDGTISMAAVMQCTSCSTTSFLPSTTTRSCPVC